jgi:hypothetical protein
LLVTVLLPPVVTLSLPEKMNAMTTITATIAPKIMATFFLSTFAVMTNMKDPSKIKFLFALHHIPPARGIERRKYGTTGQIFV